MRQGGSKMKFLIMNPKILRFVLFFFLMSIFLLSFHQSATALEEPVRVVASIAPLADLVSYIGGDQVSVHLLVPNGVSPHTFDPKPSDIRNLENSDLFFVIGLDFELFANDLVKAVGGKVELIETSRGIIPLNDEIDDQHEEPVDRNHVLGNPHIWVSLRNLQIMARTVAEVLSSVDPDHSNLYHQNAHSYIQKCQGLDQWFTQESKQFRIHKFIAAHAAWVYLARDYELKQVGVIEETPGKEPSPKSIKTLVEKIKDSEIPVVFAEPQLSQKAAQVLADEAGVKVAILDPLGFYPEVPFLETMRDNLKKIAGVMK